MNEDLLNEAKAALGILDVYLRTSTIEIADNFDPKYTQHDELLTQFKQGTLDSLRGTATPNSGDPYDVVKFRFHAAFRVLPPDLPEQLEGNQEELTKATLVEVSTIHIAEYVLTADLSDEALNEFGRFNVGYHVWPYWREFAQSIAQRMRLPRLVIPLYSIPQD